MALKLQKGLDLTSASRKGHVRVVQVFLDFVGCCTMPLDAIGCHWYLSGATRLTIRFFHRSESGFISTEGGFESNS